MGQASNTRNDVALDTVITNVVIIDAVLGIVKADLGIKVSSIYLFMFCFKIKYLGWCYRRCR
jgi:urease alpha subunit